MLQPRVGRFVLLPIVAAVLAWGVLRRLPQPRLVFDVTATNVGTVFQGEIRTVHFPFRNVGRGTLHITRLVSECSCAALTVGASRVDPGRAGDIAVVLDTRGVPLGNMTRTVTVSTNDEHQRSAVLSLFGFVQAELEVIPPSLHFGEMLASQRSLQTCAIHVLGSKSVRILNAVSTDSAFDVRLVPATTTRQAPLVVLEITAKADGPAGYHVANIVVTTSSSLMPTLRIPVQSLVVAERRR